MNELDNECYKFKLPEWCYDTNHTLIDIQHIKRKKEVLFIFRNNSGEKIYHVEKSTHNYFYVMEENLESAPLVTSVRNAQLRFDKKGLDKEVALFEQDVAIDIKHSVDYKLTRVLPEIDYKLKVLYWDIEVYSGGNLRFPKPELAAVPINSISFCMDQSEVFVYVLDHPNRDKSPITIDSELMPEGYKINIRMFDTEKELVLEFFRTVARMSPDVMAAWNGDGFDHPYIFNRSQKLGIDPDEMSPVGETEISLPEKKFIVHGTFLQDQLFLYKKTVPAKQPSYKLSSISQLHLGKNKIAYEGTLDKLYETDINKFIEYSVVDTRLLWELENNIGHIDLKFELIKICSSTWMRAETSMGKVDPIVLQFAKSNNNICRNKLRSNYSDLDTIEGAHVVQPKQGLHEWVVDFDFKSLYPSIICTMNIGPNTFIGKVDPSVAKSFLYSKKELPDEISLKINPLLKSYKIINIQSDNFIEWMNKYNYIMAINGCIFKSHTEEESFLTKIVTTLMDKRDEYKNMKKSQQDIINNATTQEEKDMAEYKKKHYDRIQSVYKILCNSVYGVLASPHFRLYDLDMAATITATGQEVLKFSISHLNNYMEYDKLYIDKRYLYTFDETVFKYNIMADTDSCFVNLGLYFQDKNMV